VDQRRRELLTRAAAVAQVGGRGLEHLPQSAVGHRGVQRPPPSPGDVGQHRHPCTRGESGVSLRSRRLDSWIGSGRPIAIRAISGSSTAMATGVPPLD
jgi:hypothetical protein